MNRDVKNKTKIKSHSEFIMENLLKSYEWLIYKRNNNVLHSVRVVCIVPNEMAKEMGSEWAGICDSEKYFRMKPWFYLAV